LIYLTRDSINEVAINITTNLINLDVNNLPFYVFEVIEGNDGETIFYFTTDNISLSLRRYDLFSIELVDEINENLSEGKLYFKEGKNSFEYRVYETTVEKSIDPLNITGGVINRGKFILESVSTESIYD